MFTQKRNIFMTPLPHKIFMFSILFVDIFKQIM